MVEEAKAKHHLLCFLKPSQLPFLHLIFTSLPPLPLSPFVSSAVKHGIDVGAGVVDSDYRGLLGVLLFNFGEQDFVG